MIFPAVINFSAEKFKAPLNDHAYKRTKTGYFGEPNGLDMLFG